MQVNIHQAKTHLSRLLEQVANGEECVIAKAGKPVARLVPIVSQEPRTPGLLKNKIALTDAFFDPLAESELARWE